MIYNGKEYKVISREGAKIGDLVHITSLYDEVCDIHEFITWFDDAGDLRFGNELTDGTTFVVDDDTFKVYRYVKDVEETSAEKIDESSEVTEVNQSKVSTKKIAVFAVMEYSFSHQGLVNKKEVDRHGTLDRAIAVSEGLNNRNRKCFYSVDGILV